MIFEGLNEILTELMFNGVATIEEYPVVENEFGLSERVNEPIVKYSDIPCRLSFSSGEDPALNTRELPQATQEAELIISNDYNIKTGSHVIVTQAGVTREFAYSGQSRYYEEDNHQEIRLEKWEGWN